MCKISVVIPIYNVEPYLEECLDSVVGQTLDELQIILVEDCSTDGSAAIAKRYAKTYPNIELYCLPENTGLGAARNIGVRYAKGTYITFCDSDDKLGSYDAYERLFRKAEEQNSDIVMYNVFRFSKGKTSSSPIRVKIFDRDYDAVTVREKPEIIGDFASWNKLFRRSFYEREGLQFAEGVLYEDIQMILTAYNRAERITLVSDVYYYWRKREFPDKSITQRKNELQNFMDMMTVLRDTYAYLRESVSDEVFRHEFDIRVLRYLLPDHYNYISAEDLVFAEALTTEIPKLLNGTGPDPDVIKELRPNQQIKYEYLLAGDTEGLIRIRNEEKTVWDKLRPLQKQTMDLFGMLTELPELAGIRIYAVRRSMRAIKQYGGMNPWDKQLEIGLFREDYQILINILTQKQKDMNAELKLMESGKRDRHRYAELVSNNAKIVIHPIDVIRGSDGSSRALLFRYYAGKAALLHRYLDADGQPKNTRMVRLCHMNAQRGKQAAAKLAESMERYLIRHAADPVPDTRVMTMQDMDLYGKHKFMLCSYGDGIESSCGGVPILLPEGADEMCGKLYGDKISHD